MKSIATGQSCFGLQFSRLTGYTCMCRPICRDVISVFPRGGAKYEKNKCCVQKHKKITIFLNQGGGGKCPLPPSKLTALPICSNISGVEQYKTTLGNYFFRYRRYSLHFLWTYLINQLRFGVIFYNSKFSSITNVKYLIISFSNRTKHMLQSLKRPRLTAI